jgi:beta-galactosidase
MLKSYKNVRHLHASLFSILLVITLFSGSIHAQRFDNIYHFIENIEVFQENQVEGHTPSVPYLSLNGALNDVQKEAQALSLNGQWKFAYFDKPEDAPLDFHREGFNDRGWSQVKVPGNWEMQGFGDPMFRNISLSFRANPPFIPREYNPTGLYRHTFTLPANWKGKHVFLRIEKCASASFVWVNGKEVGYNEGAHEPAEYNITSYLKPGRNTVAVRAHKFSDGYYLEDQDYWRLAGIFGDVWLYATTEVHLFDWHAITTLDKDYANAQLDVEIDVMNYAPAQKEGYTVKATVYDAAKSVVQTVQSDKLLLAPQSKQTVRLSSAMQKPALWTAETPNLYTIAFELINNREVTEEVIKGRFGVKQTELRNRALYLNGQPIKIHGINSHMQHPDLGHAMDEATIRRDFELLKQFNMNCIRTSHYPPHKRYLELADEYGIYIIDEAGTEAHATEYLSNDEKWKPIYEDRVRRMVLRDRNHPSILFWSAGNESGEGDNICAVIAEGKRLDPTRLWMYGGNADKHKCEDIVGPRYPTPFKLETEFALEPEESDARPSFMDEYVSVAGNGGGGLDEYWELIRTYPRLIGGAIWDYISPGLTERILELKDASSNHVQAHIMGKSKLTKGYRGKGLDLNGHDQWVEVYRNPSVEIETDQLTLALWVYPRELNHSSGALITKGSYQYGLIQTGKDSLEFYLYTNRLNRLLSKLPDSWQNQWHHIAAVYDGNEMKLYINFQLVASQKTTGNITNFPFPVNIGRNAERHDSETNVYLADAIVDEVGIFNRAIPAGRFENPSPEFKKDASLWLDFEEVADKGSFFSYGVSARTYGSLWPDRTPQPEMWQIKKSGQPVTFKLLDSTTGLVEIQNHYSFTSLDEFDAGWQLQANGKTIQQGKLILAAKPLNREEIRIPFSRIDWQPGTDYHLSVGLSLKNNTPWANAGHEVAFEQFMIQSLPALPEKNAGGKLEIADSEDVLTISGLNFSYAFDKKSGLLSSLKYMNKELIRRGGRMNVWRAPLANEVDQWGFRGGDGANIREGFGRFVSTDWYTVGLDRLDFQNVAFHYFKVGERVIVETKDIVRPVTGRRSGFENRYVYTIDGEGEITIEHQLTPAGRMPTWIPRAGMEWILDKNLNQVEWFGRGPQENYPDRKTGYKTGVYTSSVAEMYEPYLLPEDYGLRTENRWVKMTDKDGIGLQFSGNQWFNFNAYPYTTENLSKAAYTYQLQQSDGITFNFDYATSGVGCTALSVFNQYRVFPQQFHFKTTIKPVKE